MGRGNPADRPKSQKTTSLKEESRRFLIFTRHCQAEPSLDMSDLFSGCKERILGAIVENAGKCGKGKKNPRTGNH